jgi:hypothetical protein
MVVVRQQPVTKDASFLRPGFIVGALFALDLQNGHIDGSALFSTGYVFLHERLKVNNLCILNIIRRQELPESTNDCKAIFIGEHC